jgi:hypothetical protein
VEQLCSCVLDNVKELPQYVVRNSFLLNATVWMGTDLTNWLTFILRMAVQMALIRRAALLCQETFPHLKTCAAIGHRLRETGIFKSVAINRGSERSIRTRDVEERVLVRVARPQSLSALFRVVLYMPPALTLKRILHFSHRLHFDTLQFSE